MPFRGPCAGWYATAPEIVVNIVNISELRLRAVRLRTRVATGRRRREQPHRAGVGVCGLQRS